MRRPTLVLVALLLLAGFATAADTVHHDLRVRLDPAGHRLEVTDRVTPGGAVHPGADGAYHLVLHAGLSPRLETAGWSLEPAPGPVTGAFFGLNASSETLPEGVPLEGFVLRRSPDSAETVEIRYGGVLHHPIEVAGEEYQRSFSETPGLIGEEGVFLAGTSFWLPTFGDGLVSFELEVSGLTPPWDVVSQGRRTRHETANGTRTTAWSCPDPTEEVYLVAGPWYEYSDRWNQVELFAFLRSDDPALAGRYLEATKRYLRMYQGLLPPFPYPSFALMESFWETGYGMPGFTLLGPKVIRFPWILTSSYPHELVHTWWGNSVYVDYDSGNWCEGLTAYLADHLFAEQKGAGANHRRTTLKKYSDFVDAERDFPLREFRSRRSAASEAVGYGKSLMVFHMVRRAVGDEAFAEALTRFFDRQRFHRASWADLEVAMSDATGADWGPYLEAWTTRPGAPRLEVTDVEVRETGSADHPWRVTVSLRQAQEGEPFPLTVPVAVTVEGRPEPVWAEVGSCGRDCRATVLCPARPLRLDVDPAFDVMRRLDPLEVPPALSNLFGSEPVMVLPAAAPADELAAWRELAVGWARPGEPHTALDSDLDRLPEGSVWVFGRDNRFADELMQALAADGVAADDDGVTVAGEAVPRAGHSLVLVARAAGDPAAAVGLVTADPAAAIPGLARKLPHYTRYSYLAFRGDEPENVLKGQWQPTASPLVRNLSNGPLAPLALPARTALAELPPAFDPDRLQRAVEVLAAPDMEGRGLGSDGLAKATQWVEDRLREVGLEPAGDDGFRQSWEWTGGEPPRAMHLVNLVGRIPGSDPALADHPVLLMAHLDHLGRGWPDVRAGNLGQVHPGADDNASGVAALLELVRSFAAEPPRKRPVVLAVTTGEEAGLLGSRHLLATLDDDHLPLACVNLDTVGRLGSGKILVLDAASAREWRHLFMGVGYTTGAPIEIANQPLDASDQGACLERGVPAVQLTTGPNADYHRPSDTADKVDGSGLARVVEASREAVAYLADRAEPLTVTIAGSGGPAAAHPTTGPRRASLGTMPDFAFPGPGVRVQELMPGSPAEAAGLQPGDVLLALDGTELDTLRGYSEALKAHQPGDEIEIRVRRGEEELTLQATLGER